MICFIIQSTLTDPKDSVSSNASTLPKRLRSGAWPIVALLAAAAALTWRLVAGPTAKRVSFYARDLGMIVSVTAPGDFIKIGSLRDSHADFAMIRRAASDPLTQLIRRGSPAPMDRVDATIDFRFKPDADSRALVDLIADEASGRRAHGISPPAPTLPLPAGAAAPPPLVDSRTTWQTISTFYGAVISCRNPNTGFLYEMDASNKVQITARAVERRYVLCFRQPDGRYRVMGTAYQRGDARCDREADSVAMEMLQSLSLTPDRN